MPPAINHRASLADVWRFYKKIFWPAVLIVIAYSILIAASGEFEKLAAGKHAYVSQHCYAAVEVEAWDKLDAAEKISDYYGVQELIARGLVLELQPNTYVLVLDTGINWRGLSDSLLRRRIRVLGGIHEGKAAWLQDNCMKPDETESNSKTSH